MVDKPNLGPTGKYPDGRLNEHDEGELAIGITVDHGNVVIAFGTPISWLALPPAQAQELAALLVRRAAEAAGASAKGD